MDFEKLGYFYLGKPYDVETKTLSQDRLTLLESSDLKTHAICLGMTGSGKTGLCVSLLEEAAIDSIPAIIIDPKGDMANLLLQFPHLKASDFEPWVDAAEAQKKSMSTSSLAEEKAKAWGKGLADWGQSPERIQKLSQSADFKIYTPGAKHGIALSLVKSLTCPPGEVIQDLDLFADLLTATVSRWLFLLKGETVSEGEPEFLLLSEIIKYHWEKVHSLEFIDLVKNIQAPPFAQLGVLDLESVAPKSLRDKLVLQVNALLMSPKFAQWFQGEPLDIQNLFYGKQGKCQISVISISHLDEKERMFFVTTLLNEIVMWVRKQPGTSSLRCLLYMDEIFGYFPPVANPPAKKPLLTLLKQARAQGLGVVLATQNPGDIDYKGLSNIGTWWIGRLQTERDKQKILEGLTAANAITDSSKWDKMLSTLPARVFIAKNVNSSEPTTFQSRWALSFLRGPITTEEIKKITGGTKLVDAKATVPAASSVTSSPSNKVQTPLNWGDPVFINTSEDSKYQFHLYVSAKVHYTKATNGIDAWKELKLGIPFDQGSPVFQEYRNLGENINPSFKASANEFSEIPQVGDWSKLQKKWEQEAKDILFEKEEAKIFTCDKADMTSLWGESEEAFRGRLEHKLKELRDEKIQEVKQDFAKKIELYEKRVQRATDKVNLEQKQYDDQKWGAALSLGATVLGAFLGKKTLSQTNISKAATTLKKATKATQERGDIGGAQTKLEDEAQMLQDLKDKYEEELINIESLWDSKNIKLESVVLKPKKTDINIKSIQPAWIR